MGQVVSAAGCPVPNAAVQAELDHGSSETAFTDGLGRYALPLPWIGTHRLHARANGFGTGTLEGLVVGQERPLEAPMLVLRGAGRVSGIVLFPDGTPADGIAVETTVSLSRGGSWGASREPGTLSCLSVTDEEGRFDATGLRLGPYRVQAPLVSEDDVYAWADHDQEDVRLVLRSHRVRVEIRDAQGRPLPEAEVRLTRVRNGSRGSGCSLSRRPDDVTEIWGRPGDRHVLCAVCEGCVTAERLFDLTPLPWTRDDVVVLASDDGRRGTVGLALQREDGTWIRGLTARVHTETGIYLVPGFRREDGDAYDRVTLPPGRWTLEVLPTAALEEDAYEGYDFPVRGRIDVVAGEHRHLTLSSPRGGRIRLVANRGAGVDPEADLDVRFGLQVPPELADDEARDYASIGWFRDEALLSPLVAPGPWLLEIEGEGVRDRIRRVVVVAGRTLDVRVTLVPDSTHADEEDDET